MRVNVRLIYIWHAAYEVKNEIQWFIFVYVPQNNNIDMFVRLSAFLRPRNWFYRNVRNSATLHGNLKSSLTIVLEMICHFQNGKALFSSCFGSRVMKLSLKAYLTILTFRYFKL